MNTKDEMDFKPVLDIWKPENDMPVTIVRWLVSEWCNYKCPYCPQTHSRYEPKGDCYTAHAFDNHPVEKWQDAFLHHFSDQRLSLVITGGEPLIDKKSMLPMLRTLASMKTVECIRINTNVSWKPTSYDEIDKSKIILMCTFHPSQVAEKSFFERIDELLKHGFKIGMVNYVMSKERKVFDNYTLYKKQMAARQIPLHPNPLWNSKGVYTEKDLNLLKQELPKVDFFYRAKVKSTKNQKCLFPALAYELSYSGKIHVGCHISISGSFFDQKLPRLFAGPVPCPSQNCVCLDKYSFIKGINRNVTTNPLQDYSKTLMRRS